MKPIFEKKYDLGNNETSVQGIYRNSDGSYLFITHTQSREYKTLKGALNAAKKSQLRIKND